MLIFCCATPKRCVPSWGSNWTTKATNAMTARNAISLWIRFLKRPGFHCCVCRSSTPTRCRKSRQCCSRTSSWMPVNPCQRTMTRQQSWTTPRCTKCGAEMPFTSLPCRYARYFVQVLRGSSSSPSATPSATLQVLRKVLRNPVRIRGSVFGGVRIIRA